MLNSLFMWHLRAFMARFKFISLILTTSFFFFASSCSCFAFYLYASPSFYGSASEEGDIIFGEGEEPNAHPGNGREIKEEELEDEEEMYMVASGSGAVDGVALRRRTSRKVSELVLHG
jgi:hypothetical protein